jgi:hypothetical protein
VKVSFDASQGSAAIFSIECTACDAKYQWNTQPNIGKIPAGNLLISASILSSGSSPSKVKAIGLHV